MKHFRRAQSLKRAQTMSDQSNFGVFGVPTQSESVLVTTQARWRGHSRYAPPQTQALALAPSAYGLW